MDDNPPSLLSGTGVISDLAMGEEGVVVVKLGVLLTCSLIKSVDTGGSRRHCRFYADCE